MPALLKLQIHKSPMQRVRWLDQKLPVSGQRAGWVRSTSLGLYVKISPVWPTQMELLVFPGISNTEAGST